ncbi:MAG: hypothetical protein ACO1OB_03000 [Archangium sp.]
MRKKLGEILVETGAATAADVDEALNDQNAGEPNRLGDLLLATGKISSQQLARALAEQHQVPFVELPALPQAVLDLVPLQLQREYRFVPLESKDAELSIAMADLSNLEVVERLEQTWSKVHVNVAAGDEIDALHATLSGLFVEPAAPAKASALADDLFGSLDLESSEDGTAVPVVAPIAPRPSPAGPKAEDLFGDLNLESSRTGIPAEPPEAVISEISGPILTGQVAVESDSVVIHPPDDVSGPIVPPREGTGPLLDLIVDHGTGPVVETPFGREVGVSVGALVPSQPLPFTSPSSVVPTPAPAPVASSPSSPGSLPDWLSAAAASSDSLGPDAWTGALDHLAPSKLVVGLTRALLARGLVTEDEILAALGQKK